MGNIDSKLQLVGILNPLPEVVKVIGKITTHTDGVLGIVLEKYMGGTVGGKERAG